MLPPPSGDTDDRNPVGAFPSTCWSRILGVPTGGSARGAPDLEALARTYWRPVFGYIRARWARSAEEAMDSTQDFFVWVLESGFVGKADRERGSFRAFLKTSLRNFMTDRERKRQSQKRGGGRRHLSLDLARENAPDLDLPDLRERPPEEILDTLWRSEVVERATASLEQELRAHGKGLYFEVFRDYFLDPAEDIDYRAVAERYGITPVNVSNYLMYAKKRYRVHLRAAVLETVSSPEDLDEELRWLFGSMSR